MLKTLWSDTKFAALDFKVSGTFSEKPGICEIAAVPISNGSVNKGSVYSRLVNPEVAVSKAAYWIHRITSEEVKSEKTFSELLPELKSFVRDRIIIGHFANTDAQVLRRAGMALPLVLDTCELARRFRGLQKGCALKELVGEYRLRLHIDGAFDPAFGRGRKFNTAYYDALATAYLFTYLLGRYHPEITLEELFAICGYKIKQRQF